MPENKNIWLRYKTLDSCLSNPGRKYTIKDLKSEVEKVLSEAGPNSNGVSFKTLRNDLKFMESESGYNAPIIQVIEGRAILNKIVLEFNYRPFKGRPYHALCHPYYLKQFNGRWYVFGHNENENKDVWQFPLDRIEDLKETYKIQFKEDQMENWQDYFYDIVGVTRFDEKVEKIILNVSEEMIPYIITKPLHPTQKVRKIDDQQHEVEIKVIPNLELISLILSFGLHIKVKEPSGLRNRIKEIVRIMYRNYSN